jgi:hypothetical protein
MVRLRSSYRLLYAIVLTTVNVVLQLWKTPPYIATDNGSHLDLPMHIIPQSLSSSSSSLQYLRTVIDSVDPPNNSTTSSNVHANSDIEYSQVPPLSPLSTPTYTSANVPHPYLYKVPKGPEFFPELSNMTQLFTLTTTKADRENCIWLVHLKASKDAILFQEVKNSILRRWKSFYRHKNNHKLGGRKSKIATYDALQTRLELNNLSLPLLYPNYDHVLGDWKIFLEDARDMIDWNWFHDHWFPQLANLVGWQRIHLITRSTTSAPYRCMDCGSNELFVNGTKVFQTGGDFNFTPYIGALYNGVKHFTFPVRPSMVTAIQQVLIQRQNIHESTKTSMGTNPVMIHRPKDVATFWDPAAKKQAFLRSKVATVVRDMVHTTIAVRRDPSNDVQSQSQFINRTISTWADIVGWRGRKGRNNIHPDYVQALLDFKIVVVCQRDKWEDHYRLFEALVGGALVLTDPMLDFPPGLVHGKSIVVYHNSEDLQDKIVYYLEHPDERLQIAQRGYDIATKYHGPEQRMEDYLMGDWTTVRDVWGRSPLNPGNIQNLEPWIHNE